MRKCRQTESRSPACGATVPLDTESGPWYRSLAFLAKQVGPFLIRFIPLIPCTVYTATVVQQWWLLYFAGYDSVDIITWAGGKGKGGRMENGG